MWQRLRQDPLFPYFFPFLVYSLVRSLESLHPLARYVAYPATVFCTAGAIVLVWKRLPVFSFNRPWMSTCVGVIVFYLWVTLDPWLVTREETRGFNPFQFDSKVGAWILVGFRVLGATLLVPIMEEIFWRAFLMRFLIHPQFERLALGQYQPVSFLATTACFAAVHGSEWPLAIVAGLIYGGWFVKTKSLGNVIWAHGVTNLLLGIYVIQQGRWYFW